MKSFFQVIENKVDIVEVGEVKERNENGYVVQIKGKLYQATSLAGGDFPIGSKVTVSNSNDKRIILGIENRSNRKTIEVFLNG